MFQGMSGHQIPSKGCKPFRGWGGPLLRLENVMILVWANEFKERKTERERKRETGSLTFTTSHSLWNLQVLANHPSLTSLQSFESLLRSLYKRTKSNKIHVFYFKSTITVQNPRLVCVPFSPQLKVDLTPSERTANSQIKKDAVERQDGRAVFNIHSYSFRIYRRW